MLFLCALPSTVQSSIAFTSIAKGNVPAAVCAATASNLLGIFITPALVALLLNRHSDIEPLSQIQAIVLQLLVPFIVGQIASRWLRPWAKRNSAVLSWTDRGSILLVVYAAFSAAVIAGAWTSLKPIELLRHSARLRRAAGHRVDRPRASSRALGFAKADEIVVVFCGSKKSLATRRARWRTFCSPPAMVGLAILPVMVFHQLQLMVCALLARRYAERAEMETDPRPA